jgi:hypothetical protein
MMSKNENARSEAGWLDRAASAQFLLKVWDKHKLAPGLVTKLAVTCGNLRLKKNQWSCAAAKAEQPARLYCKAV